MSRPRKTRSWQAVAAWFRNSAGAIPDQKKEESKNACRQKIEDNEESELSPKSIMIDPFEITGDCIPTCLNCLGGDKGLHCSCDDTRLSACYHDIEQERKKRCRHQWDFDDGDSHKYCKKCFAIKEN